MYQKNDALEKLYQTIMQKPSVIGTKPVLIKDPASGKPKTRLATIIYNPITNEITKKLV